MANQHFSTAYLGLNIRRLREAKGLSREAFAELVGVTPRMVYDWENGVSCPSLQRLLVIAMVLGVSLDSLLTEM